jgi:hypothetical protein
VWQSARLYAGSTHVGPQFARRVAFGPQIASLHITHMRSLTSLGALVVALTIALQAQSGPPQINGALPGPLPFFPADNWWNQDISGAPVDLRSTEFVSFIGATKGLHPDFGGFESPGSVNIYGFPYVVVPGDQPKRAVQFDYSDESDGVNHATDTSFPFYPIPDEAITQPYWIEGGEPGNQTPGGDRHMLIVDRDHRHLYELFDLSWNGTGWRAGSGAFFDLSSNGRRPDTWTSADAAGLPILPGLVRYDEVVGAAEIGHAFRVTVRASNGYVWPASHRAGTNSQALPMGARLRLKSSVNLTPFPPELQRIFRAMKRYGLIVADNGSDMYISGAFDPRWDNGVLHPAFSALKASDFEVIELGWGGGCAGPSAPQTLSSNVTGQLVQLAWGPPATGDQTEYVLEAGSAPNLANIASFILPNTPSLSVMAPVGNYYLRARARSACGTSTPSNEILVSVAGCAPPQAPTAFAFSKVGNLVTLTWNPAAGASDYVIEVGSASGLSNILVTALPGSPISATAPPGTYFARLRGRNACGTGTVSNEIVVVM